jgi:D-alanyl-D-alanine carboxypeptidase
LWSIENSVGVKTGTTERAGEVLAYEYRDDSKDIFIIVMGSEDRFADTAKILDWIKEQYIWK